MYRCTRRPLAPHRSLALTSHAVPAETPGQNSGWAETPRTDRTGGVDLIQETPTPSASKRRSRWDETPANQTPSMTPTMTPGGLTPR